MSILLSEWYKTDRIREMHYFILLVNRLYKKNH